MLTNKGRVKRELITIYGEIVFRRTLLVPKGEESIEKLKTPQKEKSVCPLDAFLGIGNPPFKITPKMMVSIAKEAVRASSYERASAVINEHYGVKLSTARVRSVTDCVGRIVYSDDCRRAEEAVARAAERIDRRKKRRNSSDVLYIEMDGAMFNTRVQVEGTSWAECKIGIAFHSSDIREWTTARGETRRRILKKRIVGYIGNYKVFKDHVLAMAVSVK